MQISRQGGSLCLSRYPFSAVIKSMSCVGIRKRRATAFPNSAGEKTPVAFLWSLTEQKAPSKSTSNSEGGFLGHVPYTSQKRTTQLLSDVLTQLPVDTHKRTSDSAHTINDQKRLHRMKARCLERSNSCQVLAWSRWQEIVEKYLSASTPGGHDACVARTAHPDVSFFFNRREAFVSQTQTKERLQHVCPSWRSNLPEALRAPERCE